MKYLKLLYPLNVILKVNPIVKAPKYHLSDKELRLFWDSIKTAVQKSDLYLTVWEERREMLKLIKNILKELSNY